MSAARDLHAWTAAQVRSAMTAAMRADPLVLDRPAEYHGYRRGALWPAGTGRCRVVT